MDGRLDSVDNVGDIVGLGGEIVDDSRRVAVWDSRAVLCGGRKAEGNIGTGRIDV